MLNIDAVWSKIKKCEGEEFSLIRGQKFTYTINGELVFASTLKKQATSKGELTKALEFMPLKNTAEIQHLWGPSYIYAILYAILMDKRINSQSHA